MELCWVYCNNLSLMHRCGCVPLAITRGGKNRGNMGAHRRRSVEAVRVLGRLRGGSQSLLAGCNDGCRYVVKALRNPQGPNILCNEVLGAELYRALGMCVPRWKPIVLPKRVLEEFAAQQVGLCLVAEELTDVLWFGSEYQASPLATLSDLIVGSDFSKLVNRGQFWKAWLTDICADHCDNRQAVFLKYRGASLAVFIDQGHMFSGPSGGRRAVLKGCRYWDKRIYSPPTPKLLKMLRNAPEGLKYDEISACVQSVPEEWRTESSITGFHRCLNHLSCQGFIDALVGAMAATIDLERAPASIDLNRGIEVKPCGGLGRLEVQVATGRL